MRSLRHINQVKKTILQELGKRVERSNKEIKLVLDQRVFIKERKGVEEKVTSRLPDFFVLNSRFKTIDVLEVAVSAEELIKPKFEEKS